MNVVTVVVGMVTTGEVDAGEGKCIGVRREVPDDRLGEIESAGGVAAVVMLLVMVLLLCDVGSTAVVIVVSCR